MWQKYQRRYEPAFFCFSFSAANQRGSALKNSDSKRKKKVLYIYIREREREGGGGVGGGGGVFVRLLSLMGFVCRQMEISAL